MLFNSIDFLIFFPIVVLLFFIIPCKLRYIWLLISSYFFYMSWNPKYAILMALSTAITYESGILIEKCSLRGNANLKKLCVAASLISNLGILSVFKYTDFVMNNINRILRYFGMEIIERRLDLLLPVGISFYTFQALSYTLDVYKGRVKAERNIFKYALFVSFFPQLVAGPIERSKNLLSQIQHMDRIQVWDFARIRDGFFLMMWGFFQKLVIADRASLLVDTVMNHYQNYGFIEIALASVLFAFQIYCDFGGYSDIARGAAMVMGFKLMKNFRQPYLSGNIRDFWRRWHISLTSWFTDYLYIPLGGNRKGKYRKYLNLLIVFGISGLWHGAGWNFIVWGLLHAVYQIAGDCKGWMLNRGKMVSAAQTTVSVRLRKAAVTFLFVDFAWIFFASESLRHALGVISQMFSAIQTTSIFEIGLDRGNWFFLLFGIAVLTIVDILHEKNIAIFNKVAEQELWFRWALYMGLMWTTILFGIYGTAYDSSTFIYFQF